MHLRVLLALLPAVLCAAAPGEPQKDLAAALRDLPPVIDPKSDLGKQLPQMLSREIKARRDAINREDTKAWRALKTREDWEKFKKPRLEALKASLGHWPEPPADLKVRVTKTLEGEGFFIDCLVFESRPGLLVTANMYRPAEPPQKMPGILICHSHHNPKTEGELQDMGMTWARAGCLVLVMDQLGHGERRQHPFTDLKQWPEEFKPGRQDYYFRYNVAAQLHLVGESLIGWMVWDLMRGVDLLYQKKGIDKERIILLGAVAGGGDPAAVTAALDERITAVAPFNFGGPQPETTYPLPKDAEDAFNYLGGGSWESTRNLRLSGAGGFAPWVIVASIAPRRLVYAHEFAWDQERDPVWKRLEKVYAWYAVPERLAETHGRGAVTGKAGPENTHCNNIGPEHRKGIHAALKRWFDMPVPEEYRKRRPAADLACLTPEIAKEMKPVRVVAAELAKERLAEARKRLVKLDTYKRLPAVRTQLAALLGEVGPPAKPNVQLFGGPAMPEGAGYHDLCVRLPGAAGEQAIPIPVRLIMPRKQGLPSGCVVAVAQKGIAGFLKERSQAIAGLLKQGFEVCLVDLRGTGGSDTSAGNRGRQSGATAFSATEQMFGQTLLGERVRDLRAVLMELRKKDLRGGAEPRQLYLWGDSFAPVNKADADLGAPLDAKQPHQAEPAGALVALLTALYEDDVRGVYVRGGLVSYQSLLDSPFLHVPHDALLPGVLTIGDLPDLVTLLSPRPVRLDGLVDSLNRRVADKDLKAAYAPALAADKALTVSAEPASDAELVQWFVDAAAKK
jgi:pimeloyl-ACP methyl ester carboxylesterase